MNVFEIVKDYLRNNEYDGLYNTQIPCACTLGDFMPCGEPSPHCEPGYRGRDVKCDCDPDIEFYISKEKDGGCPYCE